MPVGKGIFKADDYYHFGKLVAKLEEFGAYLVAYSPKKGTVFAWFKGDPSQERVRRVLERLSEEGWHYQVTIGRGHNFTMLAIKW